MKKKLLAILLAVVMVMAMIPTVAFAEGPTLITEVNLTIETDFANKTITVTPEDGEEEFYIVAPGVSFYLTDKEGNPLYGYISDGEEAYWSDIQEGEVIEAHKDQLVLMMSKDLEKVVENYN